MDWQHIEDRLFEESKTIIDRFAREHPEVICSFFAFDTDPYNSNYFNVSFDTYENSLQAAKRNEQYEVARRNKRLLRDTSWKYAKSTLHAPLAPISDHNPHIGYFAYYQYDKVAFQEIEDFIVKGDYPKRGEFEDDYLEGHTRILLWKAIERLIEGNTFYNLHLASPFRLGYGIHGEADLVLRILNWPQ